MIVAMISCDQNTTPPTRDQVEVWWSEGYYPEETSAIRKFINQWSKESEIAVDLQFYSEKDLTQKAKRTMNSGDDVPDIIYGYTVDFALAPTLAWEGKLADTSDLIEPIQDLFLPKPLESVVYQNQEDNQRSFYAVPIAQNTIYIHYWRNFLEQVGLAAEDIPQNWESFWEFWIDAQSLLRQQGESIHGLGLPVSTAATDTYYTVEQFLEAYEVQMVNEQGELTFSDADLDKLTQVLALYTQFYKNDYIPRNATKWADPDNNIAFLSRLVLMTANPTLSIPGSQRKSPETYEQQMRTIEWPNKVNGEPMQYITSIKQLILPEAAPQTEAAKNLVSYLLKPERLAAFNEGSQGRFYPVMPTILERPFWNDASDPHIFKTADYFEQTRLSYTALNPAYAEVERRNVWGNALSRIIQGEMTPRESAQAAQAEIQEIFATWD